MSVGRSSLTSRKWKAESSLPFSIPFSPFFNLPSMAQYQGVGKLVQFLNFQFQVISIICAWIFGNVPERRRQPFRPGRLPAVPPRGRAAGVTGSVRTAIHWRDDHAAPPPEAQGSHQAHPPPGPPAGAAKPRGALGLTAVAAEGPVRAPALRGLRADPVSAAPALRRLPLRGARVAGRSGRRHPRRRHHPSPQQRRVFSRASPLAARARRPRLRAGDRRPRHGGLPHRGARAHVRAPRSERTRGHARHAPREGGAEHGRRPGAARDHLPSPAPPGARHQRQDPRGSGPGAGDGRGGGRARCTSGTPMRGTRAPSSRPSPSCPGSPSFRST